MDAVSRAQIIWAETRDLRVPAGGDPATLFALRRHMAAIIREFEKGFSRFEPLPARDDEFFGQQVADCATAAEAATPDELEEFCASSSGRVPMARRSIRMTGSLLLLGIRLPPRH